MLFSPIRQKRAMGFIYAGGSQMTIIATLTAIAILAMAAKLGGAIIRFAVWCLKFSIGVVALTGAALLAGIILANIFS